jgi:hypothetical protein
MNVDSSLHDRIDLLVHQRRAFFHSLNVWLVHCMIDDLDRTVE